MSDKKKPCPNCGYCPCCGRAPQPQFVPYYPGTIYPYQPVWIGESGNSITIGPDTTVGDLEVTSSTDTVVGNYPGQVFYTS